MVSLRGMFDRMCSPASPDGDKAVVPCSDEDLDIERAAASGSSLGREADRLVDELIKIGCKTGFLASEPGDGFDNNGCSVRVRQVGQRLNDIGGLRLMKIVWWRVRFALSPGSAGRDLGLAWDRIGDWRG
ncbi:MAG: hypothetical protein PHQ43_02185 [Dehalococcoidales bacterium]|nr:hypothetical protein [Dehalococcoidales bacterium]